MGHTSEHVIEIQGWGEYLIPSTHHQMMFPYNLPKDSYQLKAWSSKFLSDTYLNGKNEETTLPSDFYEPEIVEYYRTKSLCIQGHPEFGNPQIKNVTLLLLDEFLNKFKVKKSNQDDQDFVEVDDTHTMPVFRKTNPSSSSSNQIGSSSWMTGSEIPKSSLGKFSISNDDNVKANQNNGFWTTSRNLEGTIRENGKRPQYNGETDSISKANVEQPRYYNTFSNQDLKKALDDLKSIEYHNFRPEAIHTIYTLEESEDQLK